MSHSNPNQPILNIEITSRDWSTTPASIKFKVTPTGLVVLSTMIHELVTAVAIADGQPESITTEFIDSEGTSIDITFTCDREFES